MSPSQIHTHQVGGALDSLEHPSETRQRRYGLHDRGTAEIIVASSAALASKAMVSALRHVARSTSHEHIVIALDDGWRDLARDAEIPHAWLEFFVKVAYGDFVLHRYPEALDRLVRKICALSPRRRRAPIRFALGPAGILKFTGGLRSLAVSSSAN